MQDAQSTYSNAGAPATPTAAQSVTGHPGDGLGSHMAAAGGNSLWEDDLPAHSGYVRPDNQLTTPWSCAGPAAETP